MPMLNPDDRARLQEEFAGNGYLVFKGIVDKPQLAKLAASVVAEFQRASETDLFAGGGSISGHLNCFPGEEARFAYDALLEHGLVDLIRELLPKTFEAPNVGCNLNLPGSAAQHYHLDGWFLGDFIIANVAVVDTDLVNGAIDVLPGTHQRFYPYWRFALERTQRLTKRLPLQQGDVLVRTSRLWHRGMPNLSAAPRPMVAFTFADPGAKTPAEPFKIHGGQVKLLPNWYQPTALGRLRERTFVAAPVTYDAWRFVRSLVGKKGYAD